MTSLLLAFALQSGDRVLFYGDSITEQRLFTTYVETFVRTRYPTLDVSFTNVGIGGDATWGGWTAAPDERVKRDVAPYSPTHITIMLGMNDGGYVAPTDRVEAIFVEWYEKLLGYMSQAAPKAKYTLIKTSPFDDFSGLPSEFSGYNATLLKYGARVKELAASRGFNFSDFNEPVVKAIRAAKEADVKAAQSFIPDSIHPGPSGHLIMAGELLKTWKAEPLVSRVQIDAKDSRHESQRTTVKNLKGLTWVQKDLSLPFPVEPGAANGAKFSSFIQDLNQQLLVVKNLEPGSYKLKIDGQPLAETWTSVQLEEGVNLAQVKTPMLDQSFRVLDLVQKKGEIFHTEWFKLGFLLKDYPSTATARTALKKLEKDIEKSIQEATQPVEHTFELARIP